MNSDIKRCLLWTAILCLSACACQKGDEKTPLSPEVTTVPKCVPVLVEEFRELYHPSQSVGVYMNDHTVFRREGAGINDSQRWNVIGITNYSLSGPENETHFAYGVGNSLASGKFEDNPLNGGIIMDAFDKQADPTPNPRREGVLCWAPHVVYHEGAYHIFYFSILSGRWNIEHAVSTDLVNWEDKTRELSLVIPDENHPWLIMDDGDVAQTRDPMILKYEAGWLMYATSLWMDGTVKRGAVAVYESPDLDTWTFRGFALRNLAGAPNAPYSTCESPFVIFKDGKYILSVTITVSDQNTYHDSIIFVSDNPFDFGTYSGALKLNESPCYAGRVPAHCPEYIYDSESDKWYVTTAGWTNLVKYDGALGGVGIAEIEWKTVKESQDYSLHACDSHISLVSNHSFEDGSLDGWSLSGDFGIHMVNDASVSRYGTFRDMMGRWTFCSYSNNYAGGDSQTGSMRSNTFTIGPSAHMSFYVAGGNDIDRLYVALVDASTGNIIKKTTGRNSENSRKIVWDLSDYSGKNAFVEIVDSSSDDWGHIGVDCIIVN
ncbi:MAG: hypothetical protein II891_05955 [Bacteroidales bacterium]|nr:hypothetical protein [Bacteroidales bacterium]